MCWSYYCLKHDQLKKENKKKKKKIDFEAFSSFYKTVG